LSSSWVAFSISAAETQMNDYLNAGAAPGHAVVLSDQVDQHPDERQDDQEHDPGRLPRPRDVTPAEHIDSAAMRHASPRTCDAHAAYPQS
jgi:hypothetical protein